MTAVEEVAADFYETLLQLRCPGIAQVDPENAKETILGEENRSFLLAWLLEQCPGVPADEFSEQSREEKLVEWYTNMGICITADALLGRVTMREQVPTLHNLLMFAKNVLVAEQPQPKRISSVSDILKSHISTVINIIPPTCKLSSKLNYNEAIGYLKSPKETSVEMEIPTIRIDGSTDEPTKEAFDSAMNDSGSVREIDTKSAVEKFTQAFESAATWTSSNDRRSAPPLESMDTKIEKIHSNMAIFKETIRARDELSKTVIPNGVARQAMPLDETIEDIVISIEKINNLDESE